MTRTEKYDKVSTGIITGLLFPLITGLIIFFFTHGTRSLTAYLIRIANANIITHAVTLCVVPNLLLFLLYNRLDMLRASRGVLGITIVWAVAVFAVKFLE